MANVNVKEPPLYMPVPQGNVSESRENLANMEGWYGTFVRLEREGEVENVLRIRKFYLHG